MWKPPERIKHPLPDPGWPTADEVAASRLFSPVSIGSVTLAERTWVPAMVPWRATEDGFVTPEVLAWYERFARGRPGTIVVEATGIRDVPSGPLLRVGADRFLPGLSRLVETVRKASGGRTRLFLQAIDFLAIRRRPTPEAYFGRFLDVGPDLRRRAAAGLRDDRWLDAPEAEVRARLLAASREERASVLTPREVEALEFG